MAGMTSKMIGALVFAAWASGLASAAAAPDQGVPHLLNGLPEFSGGNMGFASDGVEFFPVPGEKFVPVTNDPAHPFCGNRRMAKCGNQILPPIADIKNPILQPWAAAQMKRE